MHLSHKTLQKVTNKQSFQDPTDFGSWVSIILKIIFNFRKILENRDFSILAIFSPKMVKIFKIIETHDPKSAGS